MVMVDVFMYLSLGLGEEAVGDSLSLIIKKNRFDEIVVNLGQVIVKSFKMTLNKMVDLN